LRYRPWSSRAGRNPDIAESREYREAMNVQFRKSDKVTSFESVEAFVDHFEKLHPRPVQKLRPVLVLTIENPVLNGGRQRPSRLPLLEGLSHTIALAGYGAEDAHIDDAHFSWLSFTFERNHSWKSLPLLSAPAIIHDGYSLRAFDSGERPKIVGRLGDDSKPLSVIIREEAKVIVVACFEYRDEYVFRSLAPFTEVADADLPTVMVHTPDGGWVVERQDVIRIRNRFSPEARFIYNYAANFAVLARRAVFAVLQEDNVYRHEAARRLPSIWTYHWEWAHPLLLQILFLLRRDGKIGDHSHRRTLERSVGSTNQSPLYVRGLSIFEPKGSGYELVWRGTGAYPEWRLDIGELDPRGDRPSINCDAFIEHEILKCFLHLKEFGLLGLANGEIVLSPWGTRFLEVIGSEMDDPDVLLRWRTPAGEIGGTGDVPAMDRWLNRGFRAMKRRVASIKERLETLNDDGSIPEGSFDSNAMSIFGAYVELEDKDFADPVIAAELVKISKMTQPAEFKDTRCGVVFDAARMDGTTPAIGVWFGVPLAVKNRGDELSKEPGWLRDKSSILEAATNALKNAPVCFRRKFHHENVEVVNGIPTSMKRATFVNLPWVVGRSGTERLSMIIKGVVGTVDAAGELPEGTRRFLAMNYSVTRNESEYQDGFHHVGTAGGMNSIGCGLFVGLLNEATGEWHIDPEVSQRRVDRSHDRRQFLLLSAYPVFHIDTSEDGYWAILSDGTVRKMEGTNK
jgi:hypothetical protein